MPTAIVIKIVRITFVIICGVLGLSLALSMTGKISAWMGAVGGLAFGGMLVLVDMLLKSFTIRSFSAGTMGLMIGVLCAWLVTRIPGVPLSEVLAEDTLRIFHTMLYCALAYLGVVLALRSNRQEFSLIIPYVRFRNEGVMRQPLLVDTNIIIDGRLPSICATGFLDGTLIVPRFVLDELHLLADSGDTTKRERGKRGLDCLEALRKMANIEITIHDDYQAQEKIVDTKLIQLTKLLDARLLTNDANLGRVAQLQGVQVLNLNHLAQSIRPVLNVGDELELTLVKEGKDDHQAVGFTPDGTMIVINHSRDRIGSTVGVVVSSAVQTSAGRLIFGEIRGATRPPGRSSGNQEARRGAQAASGT
jgi:uncharacterized protein YacL